MKTLLFEAPDISSHQGNVNLKSVRNAGFPAVILRAGYGQNNIDQKFDQNAQACVNLEIPTAIYWFSYALNDEAVKWEAQYAIAAAEKYWQSIPIAFDLEYDTRRYAATKGVNIDKEMATRHAILFLQEVAKAGHTPMLYSNRDYLRNYFDFGKIQDAVPGVVLWLAYYSDSTPAELAQSALWQYTSKGSINGVSGNVDINRVYTDIWGKVPTPAATKPSCNLYIKSFQIAANADGYRDQHGNKLLDDGQDGPKTQYVRRQINLRAKLGFLKIERSTGEVVKWLQTRLNECMNAGLSVNGEYDAATVKAVKAFQKQYNLVVDGVAGYNTIQMLFYN